MAGTNTYEGEPFAGEPPYAGQTAIDTVRFLVGDTNAADWQLSDGEYRGLLNNNAGDAYQAAIEACRTLIAFYSRSAIDKSIGNASIDSTKRIDNYKTLIGELVKASVRHGGAPTIYIGGTSKGEMEADREDDDLNQPNFSIGMDDNPDNDISLIAGGGFQQVVPG